jgi:hypoxanthine phosphoribosyltransferase
LKLDCLSAVSYHGKAQTCGEVIFKQLAVPDVADRDVLILDDILDTGCTLAAVREKLEMSKPRSIRICVLLSKRKQRLRRRDADYIGFEIDDEFVVGYGLDFMERYRNLPYIGVLRKELMEQPTNERPRAILCAVARSQWKSRAKACASARLHCSRIARKDLCAKTCAPCPRQKHFDWRWLGICRSQLQTESGEEIAIMPPVQGG